MKTCILATVFALVQAVSVSFAGSTKDLDTILSVNLSGVWVIKKPRISAARFIWLYSDSRYAIKDTNCSVSEQGTWEYSAMVLEFTAQNGNRGTLTVSRVPSTWSGGERLVFNVHKVVWQFLTRDTSFPC